MKKLLSIILLVMLVGCVAVGCGKEEQKKVDVNPVIESENEEKIEESLMDENGKLIETAPDEVLENEEFELVIDETPEDIVPEEEINETSVIDETILGLPLVDFETVKNTLYAIKDPALAMDYYMYITQQVNDGMIDDSKLAEELGTMAMEYIDHLGESNPEFLSAMNDALFGSAE